MPLNAYCTCTLNVTRASDQTQEIRLKSLLVNFSQPTLNTTYAAFTHFLGETNLSLGITHITHITIAILLTQLTLPLPTSNLSLGTHVLAGLFLIQNRSLFDTE